MKAKKRDRLHFTNLVYDYIENEEKSPNSKISEKDRLFIAPPNFFLPTWKNQSTRWLKNECESILVWKHFPNKRAKMRSIICHDMDKHNYSNVPGPDAYTNHHWHDRKVFLAKHGLHIKDLVPNVNLVKFPQTA